MRIVTILLLLFSITSTAATSVAPIALDLSGYNHIPAVSVYLSQDDTQWLKQKKVIRVAVIPPDNPPLTLNSVTGRYRGINADYLVLMQRSLNVPIEVLRFTSEAEAIAALKAGRVDLLLTNLLYKPQAHDGLLPTLPVFYSWPTLITRLSNVMEPLHSEQFTSVAIANNYPPESFIKQSFPNAQITRFPSVYEALSAVANGLNDYYMGDNLTSSATIAQDFNMALSMVKFWGQERKESVFLLPAHQERLKALINHFISAVDEKTHNQITQGWLDKGNLAFMTEKLNLTSDEKRWLSQNKKLRILINPYFVPFTMTDSNLDVRGMIGDILNLVSLQTGLEFEPIIVKSNDEMLKEIDKGAWHLIQAETYDLSRSKQLAFTHPLITTPFVVVVKNSAGKAAELASGMQVAIALNHPLLAQLKAKYPDISWTLVENSSVSVNLVANGRVDAGIANQLTARYLSEHYYPEQLKYAPIKGGDYAAIVFAVSRAAPELRQILDKALDNIPQKEILQLTGKWLKMPKITIDTWDLYNKQFYQVAIFAALLVVSSLIWGAYLSLEMRKRKHSQQQLEAQLQFINSLSNAIPMPVYTVTLTGELLNYNKAFLAFFPEQQQEKILHSLYDSRHPFSALFLTVNQAIRQGLEPAQVVVHDFILNNGSEERQIRHWMTLCPMPGDESSVVICGWQDVTETKVLMAALEDEKDKALKANGEKRIFLARMSHEIRTPVNAIVGFLELLQRSSEIVSAQDKTSVQQAWNASRSLLALIGEILDLEKIESGKYELVPQWVDINALIREKVNLFDGIAVQKELQLGWSSLLDAGARFWLDPQPLGQVLTNLIGNAVKFTSAGSVMVSASSRTVGDGQSEVVISIEDTGPGIAPEQQERLFQPFIQADSGRQHTGSGLGLAISKELFSLLGGRIDLQSQLGKGTKFTLTLTAAVTLERIEQRQSEPLRASEIAAPLGPHSILIVDDHSSNRLLLQRQLQVLGAQADEAENGLQALNAINNKRYDAIITDLNMPEMDGIALTKAIRQTGNKIAIWGLTASAQSEEHQRCMAAGMNACLFKPLNLQQLESLLSSLHQNKADIGYDLEKLTLLAMGNRPLMKAALEDAQKENRRDLMMAFKAVESANVAELKHHLHRINGTAQLLGAHKLHMQVDKLENQLLSAFDATDIATELQQIRQLLDDLDKGIEQFVV
ncbi:hybrid sensory histidine kinase in two-component regulatory system with EvgA [Enterobacterales bacterium 8AC]|nr:hybrid sensory histidine kinase in two-component regulatory system with EvgA [Enterobacterales bacterium 8AC]